jgi:hypothetical protein
MSKAYYMGSKGEWRLLIIANKNQSLGERLLSNYAKV